MIVVREVFRVKFGRAKEAIALAQEGMGIEEQFGARSSRILTDLTGDHYQLVLEQEFESMAEFEQAMGGMQSPEFREWYPRFCAVIEAGRREIYRVVPAPEKPRLESAMVGERVVTG